MPETESPPSLSRIELLQLAQSLGVSDADVMTRAELRAAIEKAKAPAPPRSEHSKTWVGVARRLLASVIERGLNLPDAAALIRGDAKLTTPPKAPPPVATVTLARIYAAQGHLDRAIFTLDEVLLSDPDHELARDLRAQLDLRRQETLARDADAAPSVRPTDDELTPIMPEVALREAAERGAAAAVSVAADAAPEPTLEPGPAPAPLAAAEPPVSEPESAAAAELVAPTFATAERAEAAHEVQGEPLVAAMSHDSETPPAPSPVAVAAPEVESAAELATDADVTAPSPSEPSETQARAPEPPVAGAEPPVAEAAPASPASHGVANGIAPSAARASARSLAELAGAGAPTAPEAVAQEATLPSIPGLILIEVERREHYLYWELGAAEGAPCWLHVVSHTPTSAGHAERHERRFPVQQRCGALRLEGVPADAVVRAKLSQDPDGRPVAVAGSVRSRNADFEVRFSPYPRAPLEAIAERARPALARATAVYWDH